MLATHSLIEKAIKNSVKQFIFANQRKIVWNNINKEVPKDVNVKEFLDKLGLVSNEKPPSNLDEEQRKKEEELIRKFEEKENNNRQNPIKEFSNDDTH